MECAFGPLKFIFVPPIWGSEDQRYMESDPQRLRLKLLGNYVTYNHQGIIYY